MSSKTRHARGHLKQTAKRHGGTLDINQFTEWLNIGPRRRTHRYNSKRKKMTFFGAGNPFFGHGHAGRR